MRYKVTVVIDKEETCTIGKKYGSMTEKEALVKLHELVEERGGSHAESSIEEIPDEV
mgnify:CR=1 FL=1|tara:strand:+ start:526 stop:696 length:171 start_codon:yes stop_codon:yes gene_type:complete